ncbi:MAG: hypothetical protein NTY65_09150 [Planctomycetota bacterium]|nr:hypothetical protein [Planctomycetota bacterium]
MRPGSRASRLLREREWGKVAGGAQKVSGRMAGDCQRSDQMAKPAACWPAALDELCDRD